MHVNRNLILVVLATLTICFMGAAYTLWFNPTGLPIVGAGGDPTPAVASTGGVNNNTNAVQMTVYESGIAAVTAAHLQSAGFSVDDFSHEAIALTHNGRPVPFLVQEEDGDSVIYFFAIAEEDPHRPAAVYRLSQGTGLKMQERSAQPFNEGTAAGRHSLEWSDDSLFVENSPADDAWMGPQLLAPDHWTLRLDAIEPNGEAAALQLRLFSHIEAYGGEQHHVQIAVNEKIVAEHLWEGSGLKVLQIPLEKGILSPDRENVITVSVLDDTAPLGDAIYIDALKLSYDGPIDIADRAVIFDAEAPNILVDGVNERPLVFDVSDEAAPVLLTDLSVNDDAAEFSTGLREATLAALNPDSALTPDLNTVPIWSNSLKEEGWGADYIAVVAGVRGFDEAVAPLLAHRQEEGMRVVAVPLEQIFDEFAYGHRDPQAIKDFIAYAADHWAPPAPQYVLLVGDATYDVTNKAAGKNRNRLPTPIVYTEAGGHVASDVWYVSDEDEVPAAAIGRFPAQTTPQLSSMVNKTIEYENALVNRDDYDSWATEVLLVSDQETMYVEAATDLASFLDDNGYEVYRLKLGDGDNTNHSIISAINHGVGLVSYIGQGSDGAWGNSADFQNSDAQALYNTPRLPIYNTFTSRSGSFASPRRDSLAESLLRTNNGGVVAAVAPSGQIAEAQQLPLTALFHQQIAGGGPARLGDRLLEMYNQLAAGAALHEAMAPVNLLGDPALRITAPES